MTSRDFVYWLQGYLEVTSADGARASLSPPQIECVQKHLALVFAHEIDPSMGPPSHTSKLDQFHNGLSPLCVTTPPGTLKPRC